MLAENPTLAAAINAEGNTPLFAAAREGHLDVVKFLLDGGAQPNSTMMTGESALFAAVQNGHIEIVRVLLEIGCLSTFWTHGQKRLFHRQEARKSGDDCPARKSPAANAETAARLLKPRDRAAAESKVAGQEVRKFFRLPLHRPRHRTVPSATGAQGSKELYQRPMIFGLFPDTGVPPVRLIPDFKGRWYQAPRELRQLVARRRFLVSDG